MRKSVREKLADLKRSKDKTQEMSLEELVLLMLDPRPTGKREMNPTQRAFIFDNAPVSGFMGPKGSAKTSAGSAAGFIRALLQPGSKGVVLRKDYNDLKQTTRLRFEEMLRRLPKGTLLDRSKEPPEQWFIQPIPLLNPDGTILDDTPSIITFSGLESLEEGGSVEADWAFIDEASEIEERSLGAVLGWGRNIPSWAETLAQTKNSGFYRTMLAFNPTDTFHWRYTACTGLDHQGRKVREPYIKLFTPQYRENQRNLPIDYYDRLAATMPSDMRTRLVEGHWGAVFEGDAVLREFKRHLHMRRGLFAERFDIHAPLLRFWDFGYRRPYVVWAQLDFQGRLLHFKEFMGENIEIAPFIEQVRTREKLWFPGHSDFMDYGDPAARQKKDTGSTLTVLADKGIHLRFKVGATIEEGLGTMRVWLERIIDGEPAILYDEEGCPILTRALSGGYHYDKTDETMSKKPVKDGFYDHPVDADRYGIVGLFGPTGKSNREVVKDYPVSLEYNAQYDTYTRGQS